MYEEVNTTSYRGITQNGFCFCSELVSSWNAPFSWLLRCHAPGIFPTCCFCSASLLAPPLTLTWTLP